EKRPFCSGHRTEASPSTSSEQPGIVRTSGKTRPSSGCRGSPALSAAPYRSRGSATAAMLGRPSSPEERTRQRAPASPEPVGIRRMRAACVPLRRRERLVSPQAGRGRPEWSRRELVPCRSETLAFAPAWATSMGSDRRFSREA
ncbi:hypothetical protein P7K49_018920, partial [Saguinus oedipus]